MKATSFLFGFLVGGVVASISTLLTTPKSGEETRISLKETKDVWLRQLVEAKDHLKELKETIATTSTEGIETIKSFISDLKISVTHWQNEIQPHQQELQKELEAIELSIQELESEINKK
ncbi:YtxH domain-containing protein [Bacillus sp. V3B]|uniref:YtxH domain-containing protein n=1 Tax=Bacillus sp. V3B TaxID=2804915 RepID=UPI0021098780|nr:YtxH domain-containing protein [Bacillus sp. V3B]MCQ6273399.1 YtxH domain-containing protein [Bacillus sp. V3B]